MSVDPAADVYPSLSPYSYVANNPLIYIDPTGAYIEPADDKARELYDNIYNNATDDQRAVLDRLNDSDVVYRIKSSGADEGYNGITKGGCDQDCGDQFVVDIFFDGSQDSDTQINALGDELEHARQFEDGELSIVDLTDGSGVGGRAYDLGDERKSKDAGLSTLENFKDVKADPNGNNAQKYKYAKQNGTANQYINSLYGGINQTSSPGSADANTIKYPNVRRVAYRKNGKTVVKQK